MPPSAGCDWGGVLERRPNGREHILGTGSFGTVYRGRSPNGNPVAVKHVVLQAELPAAARERARAALFNEAKAHQGLVHAHIVQLFGVFADNDPDSAGGLYLIMELMAGTLRNALLRRAELPSLAWRASGCALAAQVAGALAYLHDVKRVAHGDLSPNNVLLDADATVAKLSDFGLARASVRGLGGASSTFTRVVPRYAAPEAQLDGAYDPLRADVYFLAGIVWALATSAAGVFQPGVFHCPCCANVDAPHALLDVRAAEAAGAAAAACPQCKAPDALELRVAQLVAALSDERPEQRPPASAVHEQLTAWAREYY